VVLTPEHLARLLDLARALSGACEHAEIATIAAERGLALTGASATQIAGLREGGELAVLAEATGDVLAFRRRTPSSIRPGAPEHDVIRSGGPVWIGSPSEASERCPNLSLDALTGGPHGAAWAFLPLVADDEVNGVLTLVFDEERPFDGPTRAFLGEVAAASGSALARGSLFTRTRARANASEEARAAGEVRQRRSERQVEDRTRLYERERFARARAEAETVVAVRAADDLEHAQRLTAALYLADTARDVVAALMKHGVDGFGALGLELTRQGAGGVLETVAAAGSPPGGDAAERPTRSGAGTAEAEVFRTGAPLWLDPAELARRFPGSSQALLARGAGSWLGVPVTGDDDVNAVLSVAFPRERAFTMGDRARLALLADECASVLSRRAAHDAGAAARDTALAAGAQPADAFVVQYDETEVDGPVARILGVFTSERSARDALRELDLARTLVVHASITSWTLDVPRPRTRVEIDLPE
jgi:GAF domain-containing protein